HRHVELGLLTVEHAILRGGIAHALEHHLREHRLELLGGGLQRVLVVTCACLVLERFEALRIEREALRDIARGSIQRHQMISSSARSAPAARIASRIVCRSAGVAPSAFRPLTTAASEAPALTICSDPPPCLRSI